MNLPDLVRRKDRAVEGIGDIALVEPQTMLGRQRGLRFGVGAALRLKDAHEFTALHTFPRDIGWSLLRNADFGGGIRVELVQRNGAVVTLADAAPKQGMTPIALDWPIDAARGGYDLVITQTGWRATALMVGAMLDPRRKLRPLFRGRGVEVGPGLNPHVKPGPDIDIAYVEEKTPEQWQDTYRKGDSAALSAEVLAHYRQGDATRLDEWAPGSLDFIFSNHVFEHFANPLGVLRNWLSRLKPGGVVLGVVPDARCTFDLRQAHSTLAEFRDEAARGGFDLDDCKYERWILHTNPRQNMRKLKQQKFSIHAHYYTPEVFRLLFEELRAEGLVESLFLDVAANNKDFGFILRAAS